MSDKITAKELEELTAFPDTIQETDMSIITKEDWQEQTEYKMESLEDEIDRLKTIIDNVHHLLCSTTTCQNNIIVHQKIDECINILENEIL